jgi:hypothetical protein
MRTSGFNVITATLPSPGLHPRAMVSSMTSSMSAVYRERNPTRLSAQCNAFAGDVDFLVHNLTLLT